MTPELHAIRRERLAMKCAYKTKDKKWYDYATFYKLQYRRRGTTTIILAKALVKLLETGECYIVDHPIYDANDVLGFAEYPERHFGWLRNQFGDMLNGALKGAWTKDRFVFKRINSYTIKVTDTTPLIPSRTVRMLSPFGLGTY